jgi:hypothetical protein
MGMVTIKPVGYEDLLDDYTSGFDGTFACLFYGFPGSGKTHLAASFPSPFFIDTDRGMRSIKTSEKIPRMQLAKASKPYTAVLSVLLDALNDRGPWAPGGKFANVQTIVIDTITSLVDDFMLPEVMIEGKKDVLVDKAGYDEYGKIKSRLNTLASLLKDLSAKKYIVVNALVEEEKDENTGELTGKPLITGKYRDKAMADFDEAYYLYSQTSMGTTKYFLQAQPYKWFRAKSRLLSVKSMESPSFEKLLPLLGK